MPQGLGKKPALAWLPIDQLSVDSRYQRDTGSRRSVNIIAKIAEGFQSTGAGNRMCDSCKARD